MDNERRVPRLIEPSIEMRNSHGDWESVAGPFATYELAGIHLAQWRAKGLTHADGSAVEYRLQPPASK